MNNLIDRFANASPTLHIDSDACVAPVHETMDQLFENQPVTVSGGSSDQPDDVVVLRDGEVVASSSAEEILESVLLINSDVYISGSRSLTETEFPEVLRALEETPFRLRGYPKSDSEKLLLITVSRAIERLAHETREGTLRVGVQQLSRLVDEPGTYRVYERLCEADLDVHVYGVEDTRPPAELDLTVHTGTSPLYRHCWFVVFEPPSSNGRSAGLWAVEEEPNHWEGFWTFRPQRVEPISRTIEDSAAAASD